MNRKSIDFDNKNIKKSDFYNNNKKIFNIYDIDVDKILVSKKEQYGKYNSFKYFIGYNDNDVIRPLYLFISQTTGYINKFEKNKITMSLMVKDKQLLLFPFYNMNNFFFDKHNHIQKYFLHYDLCICNK